MVATVLKLRYRVLGNVLSSSPWQLVGFIVGALWAAGLILAAYPGFYFLGATGLETTSVVIVLGGALLTLGWVLAPIIAGGVDTTVDPTRLAPFPLSTRQIMLSVAAVGLCGVAGAATMLGGFATLAAWVRWPIAIPAAIVCVPLGVLVCVVASRLIASFASRGGGRRIGEVLGILVFSVLILSGPIIVGVLDLVGNARGDVGARFTAIAEAISWTPVAAAWAVPGEFAAGAFVPAIAKFAIAVATLGALWLLWRRSLISSIASPPRVATRSVKAGKLGWFGRLPTGGTGASWARALTYWLHDPRYLRNIAVVPLLPVLFWFTGDQSVHSGIFLFSSVIAAALLGLVPYADISYDGTAFAGILATGVRGRSDRAGRILAAASIGVPLVAVISVVTVGLSGRWSMLPAILGASLGALLIAYGVSAVSSAYLIVPVPEPGDNMFKRVPGATFTTTLAFFGFMVATGLLALPAVITAIVAAVTGNEVLPWVALAVGLVVGSAVLVGGVLIGGKVFDRSGPLLLQRLKALKGI